MTFDLLIFSEAPPDCFGRPWWDVYDVDRDGRFVFTRGDIPIDWCHARLQEPATNLRMMTSLKQYVVDMLVDSWKPYFYVYCGGKLHRFLLKRQASKKWLVKWAEVEFAFLPEEPHFSPEKTFSLIARKPNDAIVAAILALRRDVVRNHLKAEASQVRVAQSEEQVCHSSCRAAGSNPAPDHQEQDDKLVFREGETIFMLPGEKLELIDPKTLSPSDASPCTDS